MKLEDYYRKRLSQEGYDLFAVFSRFEYAMKKGKFRKKDFPDAAWWTFADKLPDGFFKAMQAAPEASIYFTEPPDHLINTDDGGVKWSANPRHPTDTKTLFDSIKKARNNLFHGDKKHDNERDNKLMQAALFILNAAFEEAEKDPAFKEFIGAMEFGL